MIFVSVVVLFLLFSVSVSAFFSSTSVIFGKFCEICLFVICVVFFVSFCV